MANSTKNKIDKLKGNMLKVMLVFSVEKELAKVNNFVYVMENYDILDKEDTREIMSLLGDPEYYLKLSCDDFKNLCMEIMKNQILSFVINS